MSLQNLGRLQEDDESANLIAELILNGDKESLKQILKNTPAFKIADLISYQKKSAQLFIFGSLEPQQSVQVFDFSLHEFKTGFYVPYQKHKLPIY